CRLKCTHSALPILAIALLNGPMSEAQPMSEASALAAAIVVGLGCDWRLDLAHFPNAAE
ncbi:MAG: hypothetical protein GY814_20805, partial [Gammaproteobacteria bacterium]|nr:hypothetical protein [Gammaproteobacteria bacterium]